jgi:hypothetical protein
MGGSGKKLKETTVNRYINLLKLPIIKKKNISGSLMITCT